MSHFVGVCRFKRRDSIGALEEIGEGKPAIVFRAVTFPGNEILELVAMAANIEDFVNLKEEIAGSVDNDWRRWRYNAIWNSRNVSRLEERHVKDVMKTRHRSRKF